MKKCSTILIIMVLICNHVFAQDHISQFYLIDSSTICTFNDNTSEINNCVKSFNPITIAIHTAEDSLEIESLSNTTTLVYTIDEVDKSDPETWTYYLSFEGQEGYLLMVYYAKKYLVLNSVPDEDGSSVLFFYKPIVGFE